LSISSDVVAWLLWLDVCVPPEAQIAATGDHPAMSDEPVRSAGGPGVVAGRWDPDRGTRWLVLLGAVSVLALAGVAIRVATRDVRSLATAEWVVAILGGLVWVGMIGRWPSGRNLVYGLFFLGVDLLAVMLPALLTTANDPAPAWSGGPTMQQVIEINGFVALLLYGLVAMLATSVSVIVHRVARIAAVRVAWSRRVSVGWAIATTAALVSFGSTVVHATRYRGGLPTRP
jgi:hypothetical protein